MPYFVLHAIDRPGASAIRAEQRAPHRERLREHDHGGVRVHVGGPLLDDAGAMIGSLLVIEGPDRAAVERYVEGDPYVVHGLFERMEIHAFHWGLGQPDGAAHG